MKFDEWWNKLQIKPQPGDRFIAETAWNAAANNHARTVESFRKAARKSMAYRDTLKRIQPIGCLGKGRCASHQVNEDYCRVCRPIMNVLYEFEPTPKEVLAMILAEDCPDCEGSGQNKDLTECKKCEGKGVIPDDLD
jgi:hypothetical protein